MLTTLFITSSHPISNTKICQFDIFLHLSYKIDYHNTITPQKGAKDGWYDKGILHGNV